MAIRQKDIIMLKVIVVCLCFFVACPITGCEQEQRSSNSSESEKGVQKDKQENNDTNLVLEKEKQKDKGNDEQEKQGEEKKLDKESEKKIFEALKNAMKDITTGGYGHIAAISYNHYSLVQTKLGEVEGAAKSFELALENMGEMSPEDKYSTYCDFAYSQSLTGNKESSEKCFGMAEELLDSDETILTNYGDNIVRAKLRSEGLDAAIELADRISNKKKVERSSDSLYLSIVRTCTTPLISVQSSKVDLKSLSKVIERIKTEFYRNMSFAMIAEAQAFKGDIEEAEKTVKYITDKSHSDIPNMKIAVAYAKAGDIAKALQVTDNINPSSEKWSAYSLIAGYIAEAGDIEKAFQIADLISEKSDRSSAYESIGSSQAKAGDFDAALETAKKADSPEVMVGILCDIAKEQYKAGDKQKAEENIELAKKELENVIGYKKMFANQNITSYYQDIGDTKGTEESFLQTFDERGGLPMASLAVALSQAYSGDVDAAIQTVDQIEEPFFKAMTYCDIILLQYKVEPMLWFNIR